jgi:hypothetical protein
VKFGRRVKGYRLKVWGSMRVSQGMVLRCRCDLYDLSAVRSVYRYVI